MIARVLVLPLLLASALLAPAAMAADATTTATNATSTTNATTTSSRAASTAAQAAARTATKALPKAAPVASAPNTSRPAAPNSLAHLLQGGGSAPDLATPAGTTPSLEPAASAPTTRFIAGYVKNVSMLEPGKNGAGSARKTPHDVATSKNTLGLRALALTPDRLRSVWAVAEIDPRLDFDRPDSIKAYFGVTMSREEAIRTYYARYVSVLLGKSESEIKGSMYDYAPSTLALPSQLTGALLENASNVLGDGKGGHYLTSMRGVGGGASGALALRQYFDALRLGMDPRVAGSLLAKRLGKGSNHKEISEVGPATLGQEVGDLVRAHAPTDGADSSER